MLEATWTVHWKAYYGRKRKRTLEAKLLDEEVGELIHEDELEVGIQVDDFKEQMELTISDLITTLEHEQNVACSDDHPESPEPTFIS